VIQVKLTKDHHLVTTAELESGKFDAMIKESFEPLMCSKHGEPLRLYCTQPSCCAPICTVCKTTTGHDGHAAIELTAQVSLIHVLGCSVRASRSGGLATSHHTDTCMTEK